MIFIIFAFFEVFFHLDIFIQVSQFESLKKKLHCQIVSLRFSKSGNIMIITFNPSTSQDRMLRF